MINFCEVTKFCENIWSFLNEQPLKFQQPGKQHKLGMIYLHNYTINGTRCETKENTSDLPWFRIPLFHYESMLHGFTWQRACFGEERQC